MTVYAEKAQRIQRGVEFFRQAELERLLLKLREKYIEQGQVGGQIELTECSARERRDIASFLGKTPYRYNTIRLKLSEMDSALQQSGFRCTLPELLEAFFPEQPLVTRPQLRVARAERQAQFRQALEAIADAQSDATPGWRWLREGQHGIDWLYARYKNAVAEEQERQLTTIKYVVTLLNRLPGTRASMRLGLFSQRTSGDPHSLDPGRPAGRLFLQALSDLANGSNGSATGAGRVQDIQLYQDVGLLVDTISSHVAVFNLALARNLDGSPDPMIATAGERILLLPLGQLTQWRTVSAARTHTYVIENPQVFEEVVAHLQSLPRIDERHPEIIGPPTVVCTSGWPSVAALTLLDLLLASNPANRLHYSGDLDLKGLQIAAYMLERYPARCIPWRIDVLAYTTALQAGGIQARENDLQLLNSLPGGFGTLIKKIQAQGTWAYQEGLAHLLIADLAS
ncbi:MAG: TIGR02679 domain-containing protein [Ktedonobacteraceae bacterium]